MSIDFFTQGQKGTTDKELFGLCDDSDGRGKKPAYCDYSDPDKWIAIVHNQNKKSIDFFAIDCCVVWYLNNGDTAKVCDGMIAYNENHNISFVELKNRNPKYKNVNKNPKKKDWIEDAMDQLKSTIDCFRNNHNTDDMQIKAYACNKQALFEEGTEDYSERFKVETGITLRVFREIDIQ